MAMHTVGNTHVGKYYTDEYEVSEEVGWVEYCMLFKNKIFFLKHTMEADLTKKEMTLYYFVYGPDYDVIKEYFGNFIQKSVAPCVFLFNTNTKLGEKISVGEVACDAEYTAEKESLLDTNNQGGYWVSEKFKLKRELKKGEVVLLGLLSECMFTRYDYVANTQQWRLSFEYDAGETEVIPSVEKLNRQDIEYWINNSSYSYYFTYDDGPSTIEYKRALSDVSLLTDDIYRRNILKRRANDGLLIKGKTRISIAMTRMVRTVARMWEYISVRKSDGRNEVYLY